MSRTGRHLCSPDRAMHIARYAPAKHPVEEGCRSANGILAEPTGLVALADDNSKRWWRVLSLIFRTVVMFVLPIWAAVAAGSAVADRSATWLGWVVGIAVFWIAASIASIAYKKMRQLGPSPQDIDTYYDKHHHRVLRTAMMATHEDGLDPDLAMLHAQAVLPPIGQIHMAGLKKYYKEVNRAAWNYVKASKAAEKRGAGRQEREDLALDALNRYAVIGHQRNDDWLPGQIDSIIKDYIER